MSPKPSCEWRLHTASPGEGDRVCCARGQLMYVFAYDCRNGRGEGWGPFETCQSTNLEIAPAFLPSPDTASNTKSNPSHIHTPSSTWCPKPDNARRVCSCLSQNKKKSNGRRRVAMTPTVKPRARKKNTLANLQTHHHVCARLGQPLHDRVHGEGQPDV